MRYVILVVALFAIRLIVLNVPTGSCKAVASTPSSSPSSPRPEENEPATGPVFGPPTYNEPPATYAQPSSIPPQTVYVERSGRLTKVAAWVGIVAGSLFLGFGSIFGILSWIDSLRSGQPATAGTVMLSALPLILGIQLLLNFLAQDVAMAPSAAIHRRLASKRVLRARTDRTGEDRS